MSDYGRRPTSYLSPEPENLPANSVYNNVKVGNTVKPQPHLMRMFKTYVAKEVDNKTDIPMIDFAEFGKKWLALFNYGAHEDHSQIPLMDWVSEVAGNPYREVRLMRWIDGVHTEVARIPAIFDRLAPVLREGDKDYFVGMAATQSVIHRGVGHIAEADGYIERNLTSRIVVNRQLSENFHKMSAIFELYGVKRVIPDWIQSIDGTPSHNDLNPDKPRVGVVVDMVEDDDWGS